MSGHIIESDNVHAAESRKGLATLHNLADSLDGWTSTDEKENVKLYSQDGSDPVLVRGDTFVENLPIGFTPLQALQVVAMTGCRKIWDDRLDEGSIKEYYTRFEALVWAKTKAPWPISPRDFASTFIRQAGDEGGYISLVSVTDDKIPEISGNVRARLITSGWRVHREDANKFSLTYVSQVDLAGSLPSGFLRKLYLQIPLCVGQVRNYIDTFGAPPVAEFQHLDKDTVMKLEEFNHGNRLYHFEADCKKSEQEFDIVVRVNEKMYPNGFDVDFQGTGTVVSQDKDGDTSNYLVKLAGLEGPISLKISKK